MESSGSSGSKGKRPRSSGSGAKRSGSGAKKPAASGREGKRSDAPRSAEERRTAADQRAETRDTAGDETPARRARLQRPGEIWGRRTMFIGGLLVLAALIGGLVLVVVGDDDDSEVDQVEVADLQEEVLTRTVVDPNRGISVRRPADWKHTKRTGVITITSSDRCVAMTLAAPIDADKHKRVRDDAIQVLRDAYKNVRVQGAPDKEVGGIPTTADSITVTAKGEQLVVLLNVGKGKKYAYLTEVVVRDPSCEGAVQRAQLILASIEYTK